MTTPKEHEVTGCYVCPFAPESLACCHPLAPQDQEYVFSYDETHAQEWCPLREGPITVRLRK